MKLHVLIAASMLVLTTGFGQTTTPKDQYRLTVDIARFRGADDSTGLTELYYSVPQAGLTYRADSAGWTGASELQVVVSRGDSVYFRDRWMAPSRVRDSASLASGMNLVGVCDIPLRQGPYLLKVVGRDKNDPARRDSVGVRFIVQPIGSDRIILSDVELASVIRKSSQQTPFYKNTLEVIPNVGGLYGVDQPCYFYAEVYNLLLGGDTSDIVFRSSVNDAIGREKFSRDRVRKRIGESLVLVDQFPLTELRTGTYTLTLTVMDSSKKAKATSSRKFFVFNDKLGTDSTLLAGGSTVPLAVYAAMSEPELDLEFKEARYEASQNEADQYKLLKGVEPKRSFLSAFWRRRAPGYREEYMARVEYANANFHNMGMSGYHSDRGRVYIMYGPPDENERHPSESDSRAYEIWTYHNIQGGVEFDFVQRNSTGEYDLVNSTVRTELHDTNWQRFLNPNFDQNQIVIPSPQY